MGKPIVQAREEVSHSIESCDSFIGIAEEALSTQKINLKGGLRAEIRREPVTFQ